MVSEIKTKVRSIRKLFIVEPNSWDSLSKILIGMEWDIEVLHNLILLNNYQLYTLRNKALIERNSPDVIINLSRASNEDIESFFETNTVSYSEDIINKLKTSVLNFDIEPEKISQCYGGIPEKVYATNSKSFTPLNIANIVNYGFTKKISNKQLSHSIFKSVEIKKINSVLSFLSLINKDFNKLNEITKWIDFGIQRYDSNEISYNPQKYFNLSTKYIVNLREWFENNYHSVSVGQNHLHLKLEPGLLTRTQKMLDNVKHIFDLDSNEGYNTSLFHK